jgi:hypothetical protein
LIDSLTLSDECLRSVWESPQKQLPKMAKSVIHAPIHTPVKVTGS